MGFWKWLHNWIRDTDFKKGKIPRWFTLWNVFPPDLRGPMMVLILTLLYELLKTNLRLFDDISPLYQLTISGIFFILRYVWFYAYFNLKSLARHHETRSQQYPSILLTLVMYMTLILISIVATGPSTDMIQYFMIYLLLYLVFALFVVFLDLLGRDSYKFPEFDSLKTNLELCWDDFETNKPPKNSGLDASLLNICVKHSKEAVHMCTQDPQYPVCRWYVDKANSISRGTEIDAVTSEFHKTMSAQLYQKDPDLWKITNGLYTENSMPIPTPT